ncbi:RDD family protein [Dawidia soli]|uniref:RDD family protein n=1 Tax=Dawidia soli TaxID=2782352 RepID=A0AAP2DDY7_9BACT|nr:RDD family protein [Dawidia soli]MBT1690299.1 RDD family protein [Dawidia soli]
MSKRVILISFAFALVGLSAEFLMFFFNKESLFTVVSEMQHVLSIVQIRTSGFLEYSLAWKGPTLGYPDMICYLMLLAGAILYMRSTGRETRLIRFVLAIILMSNALTAFFSILMPSSFRSEFQVASSWGWGIYGITLAKNVALAYLSYLALRVMHRGKVLVAVPPDADDASQPVWQKASGEQRFTNVVLDIIVCVLIFLPLGTRLAPDWLSWMEHTFGSRMGVFLLLVIARTFYYFLFETTLAATPGKLMTESRVVDVDGDRPTPGLIVKRTFARFIPFEPLTYFVEGLWHDELSYTRVVREKQTGVEGMRYWLVVPSIVVLVSLGLAADNVYKRHLENVREERLHDRDVAYMQYELSKLDTDHIIELYDTDPSSSPRSFYLKVEEVNGGDVTATLIKKNSSYYESLVEIREAFYNNALIRELTLVKFKRTVLEAAYTPDISDVERGEFRVADVLGDGRKFRMVRLDRLGCSSIFEQGMNEGSNLTGTLTLRLGNHGVRGYVTSIEILEGSLHWERAETDNEAPTRESVTMPDFFVKFSGYHSDERYKMKMMVTEAGGTERFYLIEGEGEDVTIRRLDE